MKRRQVKRSYRYSTNQTLDKSTKAANKVKKNVPKRNWWRKVWRYGPYLIGIGLVIYLLAFSNIFQVNDIDVQGPNTTLSQELQKGTEQYLDSRLLGRSWFLLNTQDLRNTLQKSFSGQESITVDKVFPSKLVIKTDEQKAGLIWKTGSRRFVVSVNGRVMSELQHDEQTQNFTVTDASNIPVAVGDNVASRQFVAFAGAISSYLQANNLGQADLYIRESTGELLAKLPQSYEIKFDATTDVESQIRALQAILEHLKSINRQPAEYIDLRINNRAFYR